MRRIRPTSPASSRHSVPTSGPRRRLRRVTQSQRAADRDQADQGAIGNAPAAVAQRRVCQLRDRDVSARQLGGRIPHIVGSYVRQALKDGLTMQDTKGFNPYKMGFGAAADSHNTAVPYRQDNFFGGHSFTDGTPEVRLSGNLVGGFFDARTESTSGLTGVWAEENTRASIFDAMQGKETFGVSGPQIKVRLFGGWEYTPDALTGPDWVKTGYAKGV